MACEKRYSAVLFRVLLLLSPAVAVAGDPAAPAEELVDPTRPVAFVASQNGPRQAEKKLQLQAIYVGEKRREAVINGRTVKVGDTVEQVKILAIGPGRVSYAKNGTQGELVLLPRVLQPVQGED